MPEYNRETSVEYGAVVKLSCDKCVNKSSNIRPNGIKRARDGTGWQYIISRVIAYTLSNYIQCTLPYHHATAHSMFTTIRCHIYRIHDPIWC